MRVCFVGGLGRDDNHRAAAIQGLQALGVDVDVRGAEEVRHGDVTMCWGWRKGMYLRARGARVIVLERGYIGDRYHYTSVGLDGLNGHARFPVAPDDGGARFAEHGGELLPWRDDGEYILLLGQVHGDQSLQGQDLSKWYARMAQKARSIWGLPVFFRAHPKDRGRHGRVAGVQNQSSLCTLKEALAGARFAITWNSNSALDAVMQGVPCYAGDRGTMAWPLCTRSLAEPHTPERERRVHEISWAQWSPDELVSGEALRGVLEMLP